MTRILLAETDDLTGFGRDLGTGTALPTAGPATTALRRGDAYFHTGLACLMVYNGAAWRQVHVSVAADTAARTAISTTYPAALHPGFRVRQTNNGEVWDWSGAAWQWLSGGTKARASLRQTVTQTGLAAGSNPDILFQTEDIDTHDGHSVTVNPNRWTCPVGQAGLYEVAGTITFAAVTSGSIVNGQVCKNGVSLPNGGMGGAGIGGPAGVNISSSPKLVQLAEGEYVSLKGYCNAAWATVIFSDAACSMTVQRID